MGNTKEFTDTEKLREAMLYIRKTSAEGHLILKDDFHKEIGIEEEEIEPLLRAMKEEHTNLIELKIITDNSGAEYLYSATEMTDRYADILLSVNNKNLLKLIADTVRYESKTYPRPTQLKLFTLKPYNIKEDVLLELLESLSDKSEYADLKYTQASNGVKFIFSEKYMSLNYAKSLAEWEEVLHKEIP